MKRHFRPLNWIVLWALIVDTCLQVRAQEMSHSPGDTPAAVVNGRSISQLELDSKAQSRISRVLAQAYDAKRIVLDEAIDQILLEEEAARRGISVEKLTQAEIENKIKLVTPDQVQAAFEINLERYSGVAEAEARKQVEDRLRQARINLRRNEFLKPLRDNAHIVIYLDAPRQQVNAEDTRAKGPRDAPVVIVEFAEFQCPWCGQSAETLKRLEEKYGDKIRVVFRDFVVAGFHEYAPKAAEASSCANEQGRFWEMYVLLFGNQTNLKVDALKRYATDINLNANQFSQCLDSGRYAKKWQQDTEEGKRYGVTGTPTFFVNGRMIVGAARFDVLSQVVDEELKRKDGLVAAAAAR